MNSKYLFLRGSCLPITAIYYHEQQHNMCSQRSSQIHRTYSFKPVFILKVKRFSQQKWIYFCDNFNILWIYLNVLEHTMKFEFIIIPQSQKGKYAIQFSAGNILTILFWGKVLFALARKFVVNNSSITIHQKQFIEYNSSKSQFF